MAKCVKIFNGVNFLKLFVNVLTFVALMSTQARTVTQTITDRQTLWNVTYHHHHHHHINENSFQWSNITVTTSCTL